MKYRIKKETKPTLSTFGQYKARAVHYQTIEQVKSVNSNWSSRTSHRRPSGTRKLLLTIDVINGAILIRNRQ